MRFTHITCALLLTLSAAVSAQSRPTVTMPNVSPEQAKNGFTAWCLTNGMDIAEAESNRVVCTKPIAGGRGTMIQMLGGSMATPLIRLEISYASTGSAVIATAKQQLETQHGDGVVERTDFKQKNVIAGTQAILDEVAVSLAPAPLPAAPTAPTAPVAPAGPAPAATPAAPEIPPSSPTKAASGATVPPVSPAS